MSSETETKNQTAVETMVETPVKSRMEGKEEIDNRNTLPRKFLLLCLFFFAISALVNLDHKNAFYDENYKLCLSREEELKTICIVSLSERNLFESKTIVNIPTATVWTIRLESDSTWEVAISPRFKEDTETNSPRRTLVPSIGQTPCLYDPTKPREQSIYFDSKCVHNMEFTTSMIVFVFGMMSCIAAVFDSI